MTYDPSSESTSNKMAELNQSKPFIEKALQPDFMGYSASAENGNFKRHIAEWLD